MKLNRTSLIEF